MRSKRRLMDFLIRNAPDPPDHPPLTVRGGGPERSRRTGELQHNMQSFPHKGLYAILDDTIHKNYGLVRLLIEIVTESTIPVVQFRLKKMSQNQKRDFITEIADLKKNRQMLFLMNDDLDFLDAEEIDGAHLGQDAFFGRTPARGWQARSAPTGKFIGLSTHNIREAKLAIETGADYIGCGAVFPTKSKNDTTPLGLEGLKKIVDSVSIPTVAIGGINTSNIVAVAKTGCTMAAVISGLVENGKLVGQKLHEMFLNEKK